MPKTNSPAPGTPQTATKAHWTGAVTTLLSALINGYFTGFYDQPSIEAAAAALAVAAVQGGMAWIATWKPANKPL